MVYTSYFANLRNVSRLGVPVAITRWPPRFYKGELYQVLAPSVNLIKAWKNGQITEGEYCHIYYRETLMGVHPEVVYSDLLHLTGGETPILTCFEKKGDFCHRHIVGQWLSQVVQIGEA